MSKRSEIRTTYVSEEDESVVVRLEKITVSGDNKSQPLFYTNLERNRALTPKQAMAFAALLTQAVSEESQT